MSENEVEFQSIIKACANQNRDDLLVTLLDWVWKAHKSEEPGFKEEQVFANAYGNRVACIAFVYGQIGSGWRVTKADILSHVNRYHALSESFTDEEISFNETFFNSLKAKPNFSRFTKYDKLAGAKIAAFFGRIIGNQQGNRHFKLRTISRNYQILVSAAAKNSIIDLQKGKIYFGANLEIFHSIVYLVYALALEGNGVIKPDYLVERIELDLEGIGINSELVRGFLKRWSWTSEMLSSELHTRFSYSDIDLKYFPSPLIKLPILDLTKDGEEVYLVPSPWDFLSKFSMMLDDFVRDVSGSSHLNAFSSIGTEFELFMIKVCMEICGTESVIDLSSYEDKDKKIADCILIEDDTAIIIEFKKSLGNYEQRTFLGPDDLAELMDRHHSAVIQLDATKKRINSKQINISTEVTRFAYVVCCSYPVLQEGLLYYDLISAAQAELEIEAIPLVILDASNFEEYLHRFGVVEFRNRIEHSYIGHVRHEDATHKSFDGGSQYRFRSSMYEAIDDRLFPWRKARKENLNENEA
jgi:hypothetical protein